jgi:biopolymer transport protein ExbD
MGLSIASTASGKSDDGQPMMEMNTTPLIDVMLVLLIIFIITIPIQSHAVRIDLPQTPVGPVPEMNPTKNKVTIDADSVIRWNGTAVDQLTLRRYLAQSLALPAEPELQFQPAADARYLMVDEVLATIKRAGVTKLGFVGNEQYQRF